MKKRRSFSREFKREAAGMIMEQGFFYREVGLIDQLMVLIILTPTNLKNFLPFDCNHFGA